MLLRNLRKMTHSDQCVEYDPVSDQDDLLDFFEEGAKDSIASVRTGMTEQAKTQTASTRWRFRK